VVLLITVVLMVSKITGEDWDSPLKQEEGLEGGTENVYKEKLVGVGDDVFLSCYSF